MFTDMYGPRILILLGENIVLFKCTLNFRRRTLYAVFLLSLIFRISHFVFSIDIFLSGFWSSETQNTASVLLLKENLKSTV